MNKISRYFFFSFFLMSCTNLKLMQEGIPSTKVSPSIQVTVKPNTDQQQNMNTPIPSNLTPTTTPEIVSIKNISFSETFQVNQEMCSETENLKINTKGNGLITFKDGRYSTITDYKMSEKMKIISDKNDFGISTISINEEGNGLIIWLTKIGNIGSDRPTQNLYVQKISNYIIDENIEVIDNQINFEIQAQLYLENNGNGLIIWKRNRDNYFYQKIDNYKINKQENIKQLDFNLYSAEDLKSISSKQQLISEKFLLINQSKSLIFWIDSKDNNLYFKKIYSLNTYEQKINISDQELKKDTDYSMQIDQQGNGYIGFFSNDDKLVLRKIVNYNLQDKKVINSINSGLLIDKINLNDQGNGIIYFTAPSGIYSSIYAQSIKDYKMENEYIIDNQKTYKVNPIIDNNGLISWNSVSEYGRTCYKSYYRKIIQE